MFGTCCELYTIMLHVHAHAHSLSRCSKRGLGRLSRSCFVSPGCPTETVALCRSVDSSLRLHFLGRKQPLARLERVLCSLTRPDHSAAAAARGRDGDRRLSLCAQRRSHVPHRRDRLEEVHCDGRVARSAVEASRGDAGHVVRLGLSHRRQRLHGWHALLSQALVQPKAVERVVLLAQERLSRRVERALVEPVGVRAVRQEQGHAPRHREEPAERELVRPLVRRAQVGRLAGRA
mmetsp:Transcript_40766/g.131775  ORF Transcript_40766/g.131775 Transcript_40766/m.131775 type:complete len:234 (-) Transcript_40766:38-739(-)